MIEHRISVKNNCSLSISRDGSQVGCGSRDGTLRVFSFETGKLRKRVKLSGERSLTWVLSSELRGDLAAASAYGVVHTIDLGSGAVILTTRGMIDAGGITFSDDGSIWHGGWALTRCDPSTRTSRTIGAGRAVLQVATRGDDVAALTAATDLVDDTPVAVSLELHRGGAIHTMALPELLWRVKPNGILRSPRLFFGEHGIVVARPAAEYVGFDEARARYQGRPCPAKQPIVRVEGSVLVFSTELDAPRGLAWPGGIEPAQIAETQHGLVGFRSDDKIAILPLDGGAPSTHRSRWGLTNRHVVASHDGSRFAALYKNKDGVIWLGPRESVLGEPIDDAWDPSDLVPSFT
ncbi:MAG: WD40 repeat domain-containing protein [Deltaproteobacteria bacterium]|nr:WD40 repeat domain-containing protein [Deltaproteobacteria bacterium]